MSQVLTYVACNVTATFKNKKDMDERILSFLLETKEWDRACYEDGMDDCPVCAQLDRSDEALKVYISVESDGDTVIDVEKLIHFICRHFPTANGNIGYADVELRGWGCSYANGGNIEIKNGKVKK